MSTETAILLQSGVTQLTKLQSEIKQTKNVTDLPSYQELLSLLLKVNQREPKLDILVVRKASNERG